MTAEGVTKETNIFSERRPGLFVARENGLLVEENTTEGWKHILGVLKKNIIQAPMHPSAKVFVMTAESTYGKYLFLETPAHTSKDSPINYQIRIKRTLEVGVQDNIRINNLSRLEVYYNNHGNSLQFWNIDDEGYVVSRVIVRPMGRIVFEV